MKNPGCIEYLYKKYNKYKNCILNVNLNEFYQKNVRSAQVFNLKQRSQRGYLTEEKPSSGLLVCNPPQVSPRWRVFAANTVSLAWNYECEWRFLRRVKSK